MQSKRKLRVEFGENGWPPLCWQWAWDKMRKYPGNAYDGNDVITWHRGAMRACPHCWDIPPLTLTEIRAKADRELSEAKRDKEKQQELFVM